MATQHTITSIQFKANAGQANAAIDSIRQSAKEAADKVTELRKKLEEGRKANLPKEQLQEFQTELDKAIKKSNQWDAAQRNLVRGVKALDEAIIQFNKGKGSVEGMSLALSKAARNAAQLQQSRIGDKTSQDWKEMEALILALDKNILKSKQDFDGLIQAISSGGKVSDTELRNAVNTLTELSSLTARGTKEWKGYQSQLVEVQNALAKINAEQEAAQTKQLRKTGREAVAKVEGGGFSGASEQELTQAIAKLEQYQAIIKNPETLGKKAFTEASNAVGRLKTQLEQLKLRAAEARGELMSKEAMQNVLADPKSVRSIETLQAAVKRGRMELELLAKDIDKAVKDGDTKKVRELSKQYESLAESTKQADFQMKQLGNASKGTATAFEKAWSRLKTYIGLYMGAAVAIQKLSGAMGDLLELSDKMGEVRKTTGYTADEVGRLSDSLAKLDTRTSITDLLGLSAAAGQLGLKAHDDVRGFTEAANQLIVALPEMGRESATSLMKIANATGDLKRNGDDVQETLERVGSTIIALRANSASAAPAITDFVSRVGAVGAQAGITIDQIAALGSTIDALGGRVEMSATALSRMIPAIRNNSFAVANAIGVTEKYLNSLSAMDQLVLIFRKMRESIKGIDTSTEEGMSQMADNVEALLSKNATMAEVMKELNQQGARAGIVFGLMSQNVDELERQLEIAGDAYKDNIALQNEYNNMNETTAAKWARLKNELEEMFVSDKMQRVLGGVIERLRVIINLLAGDNGIGVVIRSIIMYIGLLKLDIVGIFPAIWKGLKNIGVALGFVRGEMAKLQMVNIFTALAFAVWYAVDAFISFKNRVGEASKAMAEVDSQVRKETKAVDDLFYSVYKTNSALGNAKKKLEEVAKSGEDAAEAENALKKASAEHAAAIRDINSKYGQYLNFMLSETSSAEQLAKARELINAKLRETITLKQKEAALGNIEDEYGGEATKRVGRLDDVIQQFTRGGTKSALTQEQQAKLSTQITELGVKYAKDSDKFQTEVGKLMKSIGLGRKGTGGAYDAIMTTAKSYQEQMEKIADATADVEKRFAAQNAVNREKTKIATKEELDATVKEWNRVLAEYNAATGDAKKELAVELYKQQKAYINLFENNNDYFAGDKTAATIEKNIGTMKSYEQRLRDLAKEAIESVDAAEAAQKKYGDIGKGGDTAQTETGKNPYGSYNKVTSPYGDWNANDLVNRRKEMLERVKALAAGADVQAVLSEDAKFITEATRKNIKTTKDAIEWYNAERLKIQDALHEKHLTNSGDWMDPKKQRGRKKVINDDMRYYLDELDAYYTERKAKIQEARNDEEISEAEAWNRTIANEAEWRQRRAELQQLYADKAAKVEEEEQQAIFDIISERTEDSAEFVRKSIGKTVKFIQKIGEKSQTEMKKILGDLDLGIEKDFLRQRNAIGQHLKAIEEIINKENPFNGIVENLRKNLGKMEIIFADIEDESQHTVDKEIERTMFVLEQAKKGYSLTWAEMAAEMAKKGWKAWADALANDTAMQTGLMHQVTKVFEQIQDAVRKEANELKRQAEIMWSNILLPGGDGKTTVKDAFEQTIGVLGVQEGRVSRANSLIGAGQASERVADKLAIQQMKVQLAMQQHQFNLIRKQGLEKIAMLRKEAELQQSMGMTEKARALNMQAQNAEMAMNLATRKEQTEVLKQQEAIIAKTEESEARLYKELQEWASLISSSMQSLFEASNAGNGDYYNEMAKLRLTGQGQGGTYIIIDDAGTSNAEAHYETLGDEEYLQRVREIEQQNASADAWKEVMDDFNRKVNEAITDQVNAMLQNAAIDANTDATLQNTEALLGLTASMGGGSAAGEGGSGNADLNANPGQPEQWMLANEGLIESSNNATDVITKNAGIQAQAQADANKKAQASTQSAFAKMTAAANLYGIAYSAMSNENMSAAQKFGMIAVQAAGQAAITALTTNMSQTTAQTAAQTPSVLSRAYSELGPIAGPIAFSLFTGLLGGLMGLAASKIAKGKSEIAQATGVSVSSGRMATGMLTYAEGNVNEFTNPDTLTPGRHYNVDASDGRTYRAKYTGRNPRTHITTGPEFHLVGEAGREAIIDAKTTRLMQMDDTGIWKAIQTIYNGGLRSFSVMPRRRRGVRAFAEGNFDDFEEIGGMEGVEDAGSFNDIAAMQQSLDRNTAIQEALLERLNSPIVAVNKWTGRDGIPYMYDQYKKEASRHGEKYI